MENLTFEGLTRASEFLKPLQRRKTTSDLQTVVFSFAFLLLSVRVSKSIASMTFGSGRRRCPIGGRDAKNNPVDIFTILQFANHPSSFVPNDISPAPWTHSTTGYSMDNELVRRARKDDEGKDRQETRTRLPISSSLSTLPLVASGFTLPFGQCR